MLRILSGESYSSVKSEVKSEATSPCLQQAVTTDAPLKSVLDSGIDSIHDVKSGLQTALLMVSCGIATALSVKWWCRRV